VGLTDQMDGAETTKWGDNWRPTSTSRADRKGTEKGYFVAILTRKRKSEGLVREKNSGLETSDNAKGKKRGGRGTLGEKTT